MAEVNGKIVMCDRGQCGATVFLKCTGEGETDGGFTRWNKFEPLPEGWGRQIEVGTLCPKCNAEFKRLRDDFMNRLKKFKEGEK